MCTGFIDPIKSSPALIKFAMNVELPAIVHMWFSVDGAGWAFHPTLEPILRDVVKVLSPEMRSPDKRRILRIQFKHGKLVGECFRDEHCAFAAAAARNPFVLKCV